MPSLHCKALAFLICTISFFGASAQVIQVGESNIGVSGEMQLKWTGKGIPEKLLEMEMVFSQSMLADNTSFDGTFNYKTTSARLSLSYHPKNIVDIKVGMPFLLKQGIDGKTGPFGDLSADVSHSWGETNRLVTGLTLGFPTGYASIMKDDDDLTFYSAENQPGCGLYSASVRASYAFVPDWGIFNIGATYWAGLFSWRTSEYGVDTSTSEKKILYLNKAFEFARDGWGARNDAGVYRPDYVCIYSDFGIKTETVNHGISIGYSYPVAPNKYDVYTKSNTPTPFYTKDAAQMFLDTGNHAADQKYFVAGQLSDTTWEYLKKTTVSKTSIPSLTLQYNIEKNDLLFPIFLGCMVKFNYENRLNFGGFSMGIGFKFPVL
jgi:hypothetical protein